MFFIEAPHQLLHQPPAHQIPQPKSQASVEQTESQASAIHLSSTFVSDRKRGRDERIRISSYDQSTDGQPTSEVCSEIPVPPSDIIENKAIEFSPPEGFNKIIIIPQNPFDKDGSPVDASMILYNPETATSALATVGPNGLEVMAKDLSLYPYYTLVWLKDDTKIVGIGPDFQHGIQTVEIGKQDGKQVVQVTRHEFPDTLHSSPLAHVPGTNKLIGLSLVVEEDGSWKIQAEKFDWSNSELTKDALNIPPFDPFEESGFHVITNRTEIVASMPKEDGSISIIAVVEGVDPNSTNLQPPSESALLHITINNDGTGKIEKINIVQKEQNQLELPPVQLQQISPNETVVLHHSLDEEGLHTILSIVTVNKDGSVSMKSHPVIPPISGGLTFWEDGNTKALVITPSLSDSTISTTSTTRPNSLRESSNKVDFIFPDELNKLEDGEPAPVYRVTIRDPNGGSSSHDYFLTETNGEVYAAYVSKSGETLTFNKAQLSVCRLFLPEISNKHLNEIYLPLTLAQKKPTSTWPGVSKEQIEKAETIF